MSPGPFRPFYVADGDPPSKQAILESALELFTRDGLSGTNIRAIGQRAGYSNPALFKFFDSKDALAIYLFERCYGRLYDALAAALAPQLEFDEQLRVLLETVLDLLDEDVDAFLFVQDHLRALWPRTSAALRKKSLVALVVRLVHSGQRRGRVCGDIDPKLVSTALMGFLTQFARLFYFGEFKGKARSRLDDVERIARGMLTG